MKVTIFFNHGKKMRPPNKMGRGTNAQKLLYTSPTATPGAQQRQQQLQSFATNPPMYRCR